MFTMLKKKCSLKVTCKWFVPYPFQLLVVHLTLSACFKSSKNQLSIPWESGVGWQMVGGGRTSFYIDIQQIFFGDVGSTVQLTTYGQSTHGKWFS